VSTWRFIDAERANHTVVRLCSALCVSRAAWYAWKRSTDGARTRENRRLEVHLRAAWRARHGTYGAPRLTQELRASGFAVSRKRIARLMRKNAIAGVPKRRFTVTTDSKGTEHVAPNLLQRDFDAERPNQAWVADITYVPTNAGWLYVAVVVDLYARRVVGWAAATHLRTDLPLAALKMAIRLRNPRAGLIHHSDRGCQYGSTDYLAVLRAHGIVPSMSRPRDCWDNAVAESFFGSMKTEALHRQTWATPEAAKHVVATYINDFYNPKRRHSHCNDRSPQQHETSFNYREAALP
jgi:putative transposase